MRKKTSKPELIDSSNSVTWEHPGGKLRRLGAEACTEEELLAIVIGSGIKDKTAYQIAKEILDTYFSLGGIMGVSLKDLMKIKGLKEVKATKIAAAYEIAYRLQKFVERQ